MAIDALQLQVNPPMVPDSGELPTLVKELQLSQVRCEETSRAVSSQRVFNLLCRGACPQIQRNEDLERQNQDAMAAAQREAAARKSAYDKAAAGGDMVVEPRQESQTDGAKSQQVRGSLQVAYTTHV